MKKRLSPRRDFLIFSLFNFAFFSAPLCGEIPLGNKGALAFGLDAGVEYDSNTQLDSGEEEDVIWSALPKVLYRYNQGVVFVDAFAGVQIRDYQDMSEFDSESFKSGLTVEFPHGEQDGNYELKLDTGFNQSTSADGDLQAVVEKETLHANVTGKYNFTERYYLRSGVLYRNSETTTGGFSDVETVTVPIHFFYRYSEDLSLGLGYRFRDTTVEGSGTDGDSQDHAVYFTAEGRVSANVDGTIRVGVQQRQFSDSSLDDDDGFYAETTLSWAYSTRSSLDLSVGSEYETSAGTQSILSEHLDLAWKHRLNEKISTKAGVGYEAREYSGGSSRNDEILYAELSAEYSLIPDRLSLNGLLHYTDRSSNSSSSDYDKTLASIGLSFIY